MFVVQKKFQLLWLTGTGALGMVIFTLLTFVFRISAMEAEMQRDLAGNPFAGLGALAMRSVQIQWGWAVLLVGAVMVIAATAWESEEPQRSSVHKKLAGVAGALVIVAGICYAMSRTGSASGKPGAETSADGRSAKPARRTKPESAEEKLYLPRVKLFETWGGYSYGKLKCTEFEGRKCVAFSAKVKNDGDHPLRKVEVTVYFPDKDGKVVFEKSYSPVLASSGDYGSFMGGNNDPLKPGYIREFGYVVDDCPSECVPENARFEVTKIEFFREAPKKDE